MTVFFGVPGPEVSGLEVPGLEVPGLEVLECTIFGFQHILKVSIYIKSYKRRINMIRDTLSMYTLTGGKRWNVRMS